MQRRELKEKDAMVCRACGREERASEGYPCDECGTFICLICSFQGVTKCQACAKSAAASAAAPEAPPPTPPTA